MVSGSLPFCGRSARNGLKTRSEKMALLGDGLIGLGQAPFSLMGVVFDALQRSRQADLVGSTAVIGPGAATGSGRRQPPGPAPFDHAG
jgi:hypothetical protein